MTGTQEPLDKIISPSKKFTDGSDIDEEMKYDYQLSIGVIGSLSGASSPTKKQKQRPPQLNMLSKSAKVYDSDREASRARSSSSDGGYFNPSDDFLSDDDSGPESTPKNTLQGKTNNCSCFGLLTSQIIAKSKSEMVLAKPQGLFGQLSYKEVCQKIGESSKYCGL